jgi:hypothetical protein
MTSTNERVFILMAILCATFGCKGAGALQVVGVAAVTAVRVAAVAAAASHASEASRAEEETAPPPPPPPAPVAVVATPCVELTPGVDAPPAARAVRCGDRVLLQAPTTGAWRDAY